MNASYSPIFASAHLSELVFKSCTNNRTNGRGSFAFLGALISFDSSSGLVATAGGSAKLSPSR